MITAFFAMLGILSGFALIINERIGVGVLLTVLSALVWAAL